MNARIFAALLLLVAPVFSAAPSWVKAGANLNYTVGTDAVSFTVTERNSSDIHIKMLTASTGKNSYPTEDATADYGQFWVDASYLPYASPGETYGDFYVVTQGTLTFAGKDWDTVTLEMNLGGAKTRKIVDRDSGLLLKQTVDTAGAPTVTLVKYYVADWETAAPSPPAPTPPAANNTPAQNNTAPSGSGNTQQNATTGSTQQQQSTSGNSQLIPQEEPAPQETANESDTDSAKKKKPFPGCSSSAFLLLVVGFAALGGTRR